MADWDEIAVRVSTFVSQMVTVLIVVELLMEDLGLNLFELMRLAILLPRLIPLELLLKFWPLWMGMKYLLDVVIIADIVYVGWYTGKTGKEIPPASYAKAVAALLFVLSFMLALVFRTHLYAFICLSSLVSLAITAVKGEVEL